jgi:hypothetical protein
MADFRQIMWRKFLRSLCQHSTRAQTVLPHNVAYPFSYFWPSCCCYLSAAMICGSMRLMTPALASTLRQIVLPDNVAFTPPNCNGPQTRLLRLANKSGFEPTIAANMRGLKPTLAANEPTFMATSSQTAMWTHINCIRNREGVTVREKQGYPFIRTRMVRFIGGFPDIADR